MIVSAKAAHTYEYLDFESNTQNMMPSRKTSIYNNATFDEECLL